MSVETVQSFEDVARLLVDAASPVVVIPVHDAFEDAVQCYDAVLRHTPHNVAILVIDDCSIDSRVVKVLTERTDRIEHSVVVLSATPNQGFVTACNAAFEAARPHDVVILNSDVIVGPEWLERLRDAALSSSTVATASTLTNHGSILSLPNRNTPTSGLLRGLTAEEASRRVAQASARLRPTIPTAVGHCVYFRRDVLDLLGGFDEAFAPGYGEEVDFSQRAVAHGYRHICADDVFTFHRGSASFSRRPEAKRTKEAHDKLNDVRYAHYQRWVSTAGSDLRSPLADALANARRALLGLSVGLDARILAEEPTGSHVVALETLRALSRRPDIARVEAFVQPDMESSLRDLVGGLPNVRLHPVHHLGHLREPVVDVMYRPYQVRNRAELRWLRSLGHRLIVNQLDAIAFNNPSYFEDVDEWIGFRDLTREMGAVVDGISFLSADAENETRAQGLVPRGTPTRVVYCGVDRPLLPRDDAPSRASDMHDGFLLCLGASFRHKNRPFAMAVWQELRARGSDRALVFAGPTPTHGGSASSEALLKLASDDFAEGVIDLGSVSEAEKQWLYRHAGLVLYPTIVEGFGLVPFEAARVGTATLSTRQGSLDEILPDSIPTIDGWDVKDAADLASKLLEDEAARESVCELLMDRARGFTWDRTVEELTVLMLDVLTKPSGRVLSIEGESSWERFDGGGMRGGVARRLVDLVETRILRSRHWQREVPPGSKRRETVDRVFARIRAYL
ncbi:MAG: glycosyltransferase [Acidimicrobiia bacterium]